MPNVDRKLAFVLVATGHGSMILNRLDYHVLDATRVYGVGIELFQSGQVFAGGISLSLSLLDLPRRYFGDGVVAIDRAANIGVHTVGWAKRMTGWGSLIAFEAQERVFCALAGNIALNNCFNARAVLSAVAASDGTMKIPTPDYLRPGTFGSLVLKKRDTAKFIGQPVNCSAANLVEVPAVRIDSLAVPRIDMMNVDVEGMEWSFRKAQPSRSSLPVLMVEWVESKKTNLASRLTDHGDLVFEIGMTFLALHKTDKLPAHMGKSRIVDDNLKGEWRNHARQTRYVA